MRGPWGLGASVLWGMELRGLGSCELGGPDRDLSQVQTSLQASLSSGISEAARLAAQAGHVLGTLLHLHRCSETHSRHPHP